MRILTVAEYLDRRTDAVRRGGGLFPDLLPREPARPPGRTWLRAPEGMLEVLDVLWENCYHVALCRAPGGETVRRCVYAATQMVEEDDGDAGPERPL